MHPARQYFFCVSTPSLRVLALLFLSVILFMTACARKEYCDPTAIAQAVKNGDAQLVKVMLERPLKPENTLGALFAPDQYYSGTLNAADGQLDFSVLHLAAEDDRTEIVKMLLDHGVLPDIHTKQGLTPLAVAVVNEKTDIVTLLLDHKADPNASDPNGPLLGTAVTKGNIAIVKMLLDKGADPNGRTNPASTLISGGSDTPFCHAALGDQIEILKLLVQKGVNVDQPCVQDISPIYTTEKPEIAKVLVDAGATVEVANIQFQCNRQVLKILLPKLSSIERFSAAIALSATCHKN